jgi:serine/threonine protein kinase
MPDKAAQKALRGEMEMMKELGGSGSGLPEIYDWAEENGRAYLVMEYIDGMTLREYIRWNGRLSEKKSL